MNHLESHSDYIKFLKEDKIFLEILPLCNEINNELLKIIKIFKNQDIKIKEIFKIINKYPSHRHHFLVAIAEIAEIYLHLKRMINVTEIDISDSLRMELLKLGLEAANKGEEPKYEADEIKIKTRTTRTKRSKKNA
jgi:DNA-binding transcriptional MerR regulator